MEPVLEFKSVSKTLGKGVAAQKVLTDVSLDLFQGDIAAIIGPSGSGKSTLLSLAGLLNTPDAGEIRLNGTRISNQTKSIAAKHRRLDFGYVFQHFNLIPVLSALENIELSLHCLLYTSPSPRDLSTSRMPSSA